MGRTATILTKRVIPNGATVRLTADVAPGGSVRVSVEGVNLMVHRRRTLALVAPQPGNDS